MHQVFKRKSTCPFCRVKIKNQNLKVDKDFARQIQKYKSEEFEEKKDELRIAGLLIGDKITIQFEVGNHYKHLRKGEYIISKSGYKLDQHWTAFVRMKDSNGKCKIS